MRYMLLIYQDEKLLDDDIREVCYQESLELAHDLKTTGKFIATAPLEPVAVAASVRVRDGKRIVTDGPFAETREQLGGYFLVDAQDQNEAIAIAARIPGARRGTVEVRPVIELDGVPESYQEKAAARA